MNTNIDYNYSDNYQSPTKKIKFDPAAGLILKSNHNPVVSNVDLKGTSILQPQTEIAMENLAGRRVFSQVLSEPLLEKKPVEWADAYDEACLGNYQRLIGLVKAGLLDELENDDIEEIFESGLADDQPEIIYACLKKGVGKENQGDALQFAFLAKEKLPLKREIIFECCKGALSLKDRCRALWFAINRNDVELTEMILKGVQGQEPIPFPAWSKGDPFAIEGLKNKGTHPSIIDLLLLNAEASMKVIEECEWRATLANIWGLHGQFRVNDEKVKYQGAFIHFFIDRILAAIKAFQFESPGEMNEEFLEMLNELIEGSKTSIDEKLQTFKNQKPILIHVSLDKVEHQVELVLLPSKEKTFLLICNKGYLSEVPVKVFSVDPNLVNEKFFKIIQTASASYKAEEAEKFFGNDLPKMLKGRFHKTLTNLLTDHWIDKSLDQLRDNCAWESLRTAIFGAFAALNWMKNKQVESILEAFQEVFTLDKYMGLWAVGEYLNHSKDDPSILDRKLIEAILKKAENRVKQGRACSKKLNQIVTKYEQATSHTVKDSNKIL